jgi:hypothetical protein
MQPQAGGVLSPARAAPSVSAQRNEGLRGPGPEGLQLRRKSLGGLDEILASPGPLSLCFSR